MQRIANPSSRIRMHRFESCTLRQLRACRYDRLFLFAVKYLTLLDKIFNYLYFNLIFCSLYLLMGLFFAHVYKIVIDKKH